MLPLVIGIGGDLGLSLTGLRIGPIDPVTKAAKVGLKNEVVKPDHSMASLQPRIMKVLCIFQILGTYWLLWRFQNT